MNPRDRGEGLRATARRGTWLALAVCLLATTGCGWQELNTEYGQHRIPLSDASVNGTDALSGMYAAAGHAVETRRVLITGALDDVKTIVWCPDDMEAPGFEVCDWFDDWLAGGTGRTLVYVGRDFDAEPLYWKKVIPLVPAEERQRYENRARSAGVTTMFRKMGNPNLECEWFEIEKDEKPPEGPLDGPWAAAIDVDRHELELRNRLVPSLKSEKLLTWGDEVLAARIARKEWHGNQLILVANGSFLLNEPLVNHEHRKLAGKLVALSSAGPVVLLESGPGDPPIDPEESTNSFWSVFGVWPLSAVLLHLGVLGLIFCFARWPIFGRPRVPAEASTSDFGKHVGALGELLRRTKDRQFALDRVAEADAAPPPRKT